MKILIFIILLHSNCKYQTVYDSSDPKIKSKAGVLFYEDKFLTGTIREFIPVLSETHLTDFKNGIQHGEFKVITLNGKILQKMNFRNGNKHGISKSWFLNGNLKSFSEFKDGIYINDRIDWYDNGIIANYDGYSNEGKIQVVKKWFKNGKIYMNVSFKDNGSSFGLPGSKLCEPIKKTSSRELIQK